MKSKGREYELFKTILASNTIQLLEDPRQLPKHGTLNDVSAELQMLFSDININLYRHYPDPSVTPGVLLAKEPALSNVFKELANALYKEEKSAKRHHFKLKKPSNMDDKELASALAKSMAELMRINPLAVGNSETIFAFSQIVAGSVGHHLGFDRMDKTQLADFMSNLEQCAVVPAYRQIPEEKLKALTASIAVAITSSKALRPAAISDDVSVEPLREHFKPELWESDTSHLWAKDNGLMIESVSSDTHDKVDCLITLDGQCVPVAFIEDWAKRNEKPAREFRLKEQHLDRIFAEYGINITIPSAEKIDGISLKNGVPLLKLDEDLLTSIPLKHFHELEESARSHGWSEHLDDPFKLSEFVKHIERMGADDLEKQYGISKKEKSWLDAAGKRLKNGMLTRINDFIEAAQSNEISGRMVKAAHVDDPKALVISGGINGSTHELMQELASGHFGQQGFVLVSDQQNLSQLQAVNSLKSHGYKPDPASKSPYPFAERMIRAIRNRQLKFLRDSQCYNVCAETSLTPDRTSTEDFLMALKKTGADIDVVSIMEPLENLTHTAKTTEPLKFLLLSSRASRNQFMGISALQTREDTSLHHDGFIPRGSHVVDTHVGLVKEADKTYKPIAIIGNATEKHSPKAHAAIVDTLDHARGIHMPSQSVTIPIRSNSPDHPDRELTVLDTEKFNSYIAQGAKINPQAKNASELFVDTHAEGLLNVSLGAQAIENTLKRMRAEQHIHMGNTLLTSSINGISELKDAINDPDGLGKEFVRAVEMIRNANGRVLITGVGKSLRVGELIAASFMSLGIACDVIDPTHGVHGDLGKIDKKAGDVLIAISKSGGSKELIPVVNEALERGMKIISVTHKEQSFLGKTAKEAEGNGVLLQIPDSKEPSPFSDAEDGNRVSPPTVSTTQVKVLMEAIGLAVAHSKGMSSQEFGRHHPAGALGHAAQSGRK